MKKMFWMLMLTLFVGSTVAPMVGCEESAVEEAAEEAGDSVEEATDG